MKKRLTSFFSLFLLLLAVPLVVFAHSGGTDANGGHYDSSTGEYHYHHGYPAHQHPNGVCPYDYDDKADQGGGSDLSGDSIAAALTEAHELQDKAYQDGYDEGEDAGYTSGHSDGYHKGYTDGKKKARNTQICLYIALGAATIILFSLILVARKGRKLEDENARLDHHLSDKKAELDTLAASHDALTQDYKSLLIECRAAKSALEKCSARTTALIKDYNALYQDYLNLTQYNIASKAEEELANYSYSADWLLSKSRPAPKEAKRIRDLEKETRNWVERALRAESELDRLKKTDIIGVLTSGTPPK